MSCVSAMHGTRARVSTTVTFRYIGGFEVDGVASGRKGLKKGVNAGPPFIQMSRPIVAPYIQRPDPQLSSINRRYDYLSRLLIRCTLARERSRDKKSARTRTISAMILTV